MSEQEFEALISRRGAAKPAKVDHLQQIIEAHGFTPKRGKPNKTESEYGRMLELEYGCKPRFEALTLVLENSHRYSADWVVTLPDGSLLLTEVKNAGYKHASYGRSKMAFNQARLDFPMFKYRWAEKSKDGWNVTNY